MDTSLVSAVRETIDDGHKPGRTTSPTTLTFHSGKQSSNFATVFDQCLPEIWCNRAYTYSLERGCLLKGSKFTFKSYYKIADLSTILCEVGN
jgi:hypothetical protein